MNVQLSFLTDATFTHAPQSFVLYPGARAVFSYPCPYGDCDGIYDLNAEADQTLNRQRPRVTGISTCGGTRTGSGEQSQRCGLSMRFTISAKHDPDVVACRS